METLGKVLGKGTEKVRTWYNNRRALDRKLGIHVMRNHDAAVDTTPHPTPDHTNETAEETVVLPMRFITSPSSLNSAHPITPSKSLSDSPIQALRGANDASLITVTPSAIAWAPSTSPVTRATPNNVVPTPPALDAPNRFRISPLRIRNVRLKIGNTEISGELPEDLRADTGLEVKFLFGKKRIVYEWYCGTNYADAQSTGGPYAKVEMNFSSVNTMQLQKGGAKSILLLSFSTAPTLFLQTPESMDKYKVRSQQRQYQKVMPSHFPILVSSGSHSICMRTDDAVRVSKILIEDTPSLGSVFDVTYRQSFPPSASPQIRSRAGVSVKQEWASGSEPIHKDAEQSLGVARRRPLTVLELSSKQNIEAGGQEVETRSQAMTLSPFTNVIKRSPEPACIQNEFCPSTSANPFATPSSHKSPTTPLTLSARRLRGENPLWLTTSASGNATPTPFPGRLERRDALRENQVRRELNFNVLTKTHPDSQTPTETGHKRKAHIAFGDENVRNAEDHGGTHVDLRMLSPLPNSDTAALRGSNVRPPSKRHLASSAIRKDGTDSRRGNVVGGASSAGVGRNLPR